MKPGLTGRYAALQNRRMTALVSTPALTALAMCSVACARFASKRMEALAYPGSELPRGYFCSVTPP